MKIEIEIDKRKIERISPDGGWETAELYSDWIAYIGDVEICSGVDKWPCDTLEIILKVFSQIKN